MAVMWIICMTTDSDGCHVDFFYQKSHFSLSKVIEYLVCTLVITAILRVRVYVQAFFLLIRSALAETCLPFRSKTPKK